VLINSKPATIMIDTDLADVAVFEPLNIKIVEKIIGEQRSEIPLSYIGLIFREYSQVDHNG
jgi:carbamoylphosphate synthase large subunit